MRTNAITKLTGQTPPPDIISYAVWFCYRFNLRHRDLEDWVAHRTYYIYDTVQANLSLHRLTDCRGQLFTAPDYESAGVQSMWAAVEKVDI